MPNQQLRPSRFKLFSIAAITSLTLLATSCSNSAEATPATALENYAAGVEASYKKSLDSAKALDTAIDAFLTTPSATTLDAARKAWLTARDDYGRTEAFRFYDGPIDNEENGKEGQINAWPLDEAYIDYVEGNANAGIINNPTAYPTINVDVLTEANEKDGETNISTGWHAIEFLLWGQDLSEAGAGNRPASDYVSAPNSERRKTYLSTVSDLLITDITELVEAWAPEKQNYRAEFTTASSEEALRRMITGIGELSRGELSGERMSVAFLNRSQEDEHSCFSDNTHKDIVANADGIQRVVTGDYGNGVKGVGLADLVETKDKKLAQDLRDQVANSVRLANLIPTPFDKSLRSGVADTDPGRVAISDTMEALNTQTDTIVNAAKALGVTINVS